MCNFIYTGHATDGDDVLQVKEAWSAAGIEWREIRQAGVYRDGYRCGWNVDGVLYDTVY